MVKKRTYGIDNTHGIDLDSWSRIGTPESHTYKEGQVLLVCRIYFIYLKLEGTACYAWLIASAKGFGQDFFPLRAKQWVL